MQEYEARLVNLRAVAGYRRVLNPTYYLDRSSMLRIHGLASKLNNGPF